MTPLTILSHRAPLVLLVAGVGALGFAYAAEVAFGLAPCVLCLYQRVPYAVVIVLAATAMVLRNDFGRRAALALAGIALLVGGGIAVYHVGVEQHWWAGTAACAGALPDVLTVEQLRAQLTAKPPARCDQPAWSLFGISMAGYNVALSIALAIVAFGAARKRTR
ncbi:MAG: disulfide bond formation protein B [Rhodospirillales bacterium]|nr:disulfide bond formation protein B [Rhodospirillales bacterium]